MAHLLAPGKLRPHFSRLDTSVHPGDEKVIEHVGTLGDEASVVPRHRFDQTFDEFLAELLNHVRGTPGQELRRVAHGGVDILAAVDDYPETVEHVRTCGAGFPSLFNCSLLARP